MDLSVLMANVFTMPFTVMEKMTARMEVTRDNSKLKEGTAYTLTCTAKGDPAPTVQWTGPQSDLREDLTMTNDPVSDEGDDSLFTVDNKIDMTKSNISVEFQVTQFP